MVRNYSIDRETIDVTGPERKRDRSEGTECIDLTESGPSRKKCNTNSKGMDGGNVAGQVLRVEGQMDGDEEDGRSDQARYPTHSPHHSPHPNQLHPQPPINNPSLTQSSNHTHAHDSTEHGMHTYGHGMHASGAGAPVIQHTARSEQSQETQGETKLKTGGKRPRAPLHPDGDKDNNPEPHPKRVATGALKPGAQTPLHPLPLGPRMHGGRNLKRPRADPDTGASEGRARGMRAPLQNITARVNRNPGRPPDQAPELHEESTGDG